MRYRQSDLIQLEKRGAKLIKFRPARKNHGRQRAISFRIDERQTQQPNEAITKTKQGARLEHAGNRSKERTKDRFNRCRAAKGNAVL